MCFAVNIVRGDLKIGNGWDRYVMMQGGEWEAGMSVPGGVCIQHQHRDCLAVIALPLPRMGQ